MNEKLGKLEKYIENENKLRITSWLVYDIILLKLVEKSGLHIIKVQELKSWLEVPLLKISSTWVIVKQQQQAEC